jgi:hypothetical protein
LWQTICPPYDPAMVSDPTRNNHGGDAGKKRPTRHGNRASVLFHRRYVAIPRIDDRLKPYTNQPEEDEPS